MTLEQRVRLYCCFKACPTCGAPRGEYCTSRRSYRWRKAYHWQRGPFAEWRPRGWTLGERARYAKLKAQILAEGEIPGHE